jgi:hypothetical protein
MGAEDLRKQSRDELIERARSMGVHRPSTLTKVELLDEIVRRRTPADTRAKVRGWLGVARDLVARVIDRGLHLPEAAQLFRGAPAPSVPKPPPPLPTVTLAEIYGAQGYCARAVNVLDDVLDREPDHAEAGALRMRFCGELTDAERARLKVDEPRPEKAREETAPTDALAEVEAPSEAAPVEPSRYDLDEMVALPTDPHTAYVYWELRPVQLARARWADPSGRLVLRVLTVAPSGMSTESTTRDVPVDQLVGDRFLRGLTSACELRLCIGWSGDKGFLPLVIAPELKMPRDDAAGEVAASFNGMSNGSTMLRGTAQGSVASSAWTQKLSAAAAAGAPAGPPDGSDAPSRAAARRLRGYLAQLAGGERLPLVELSKLQVRPGRGGASDLYQSDLRRVRADLGGASDLAQLDAGLEPGLDSTSR